MNNKLSLIITTINPYKNIRQLDYISKKNLVNFIIVGDKKTRQISRQFMVTT